MSIEKGMLVEMVPWLYENEGEDCSMLVAGEAFPGKLFGVVLEVTTQPDRNNGTPKPDLAEVLFNDGNVINISVVLLKEIIGDRNN